MIKVINSKEWQADMRKASLSLGIDVVLLQKKLALDIFGDVVAGTPVLTGRAMNNWNISVQTIDRSTRKRGGPASGIESDKHSAALAELATLQPFQTIWISNNLPYIGFLEDGSSDKAPNGWVERAIQDNLAVLN